jgi:hypothetical protein
MAGAGGRQGFEAKAGEHLGRTGIPRIGNDKRPFALVQGLERLGSPGLCIHESRS